MDSAKNLNAVFNVLGDQAITLDELEKISPINRHETVKVMSSLITNGAAERLENGVYRITEYGKSLKTSGDFQQLTDEPKKTAD